jgi:hypothetical protein
MSAVPLQGKKGKPQRGDGLADAEFLHDAWFTGNVDGACDVDGEVEDAHLEGDQMLPAVGPVLGILNLVSERCIFVA